MWVLLVWFGSGFFCFFWALNTPYFYWIFHPGPLLPSGNSLKGRQTSLATNNIFKGSINQKKILTQSCPHIHSNNQHWTVIIKTSFPIKKSKSTAPQKCWSQNERPETLAKILAMPTQISSPFCLVSS